jgi:hypothetical protein
MADSTGPILAVGAITMVNQSVLNGRPVNWRIPIGTGVAAVALALTERLSRNFAVGIAYIALITILFARVDPTIPSPAESALRWWNQTKG